MIGTTKGHTTLSSLYYTVKRQYSTSMKDQTHSGKSENLDLTLNTKYSDSLRDYGSGNKTFKDVVLDDFLVNDLSLKYNYLNSSCIKILNE